jgi:glutamate formiminotransferase/glutamate formiminotransferase/formiminotetrahydrofolate cyclodeaminase
VQVTRRLLAVPNVSEGRNRRAIARLGDALTQADGDSQTGERAPHSCAGVQLLDVHSDPDHDRSVFTFSAPRRELADALLRLAREAVVSVDVMSSPARGQHPHVGALDVCPVVYLDSESRGAACAEALVVADRIGSELEVPVFLYGEMAGGRTRAQLRRGGVRGLAESLAAAKRADGAPQNPANGPVHPDFGPARLHPTAGATLVAAREPLVAFNVKLGESADVERARQIASEIREGGERGLPGVRALGIALGDGSAQVSTNVERPLEVPLAAVVQAIARCAAVAGAEIVGLAPAAALAGFPPDVTLVGFDPERHVIENALRSCGGAGTA